MIHDNTQHGATTLVAAPTALAEIVGHSGRKICTASAICSLSAKKSLLRGPVVFERLVTIFSIRDR